MKDLFIVLFFGGFGEIGMNGLVLVYQGWWLFIDCGVLFFDVMEVSVDLVLFDFWFFVEYGGSFGVMVLIYGYEDYIGVVFFVLK